MIEELMPLGNTVGIVDMILTDDSGESKKLTLNNAIVATSKEIVARNLLIQPGGTIDKIEAYNSSGTLLKSKDISVRLYETNGGNPTARFQLTFVQADFNGTIGTLKLVASQLNLAFSQLAGLALVKNGTQQLTIDWSLIIQ